jgi:hypothetical protein
VLGIAEESMIVNFKKMASFGLIPALVLAIAVLPGCGGYNGVDACDDSCNCQGCSDAEYAECVDTAEDQERRVEDEGCIDFYDDYLACAGDEFSCVNGKVDLDGCETELGRVVNCLL